MVPALVLTLLCQAGSTSKLSESELRDDQVASAGRLLNLLPQVAEHQSEIDGFDGGEADFDELMRRVPGLAVAFYLVPPQSGTFRIRSYLMQVKAEIERALRCTARGARATDCALPAYCSGEFGIDGSGQLYREALRADGSTHRAAWDPQAVQPSGDEATRDARTFIWATCVGFFKLNSRTWAPAEPVNVAARPEWTRPVRIGDAADLLAYCGASSLPLKGQQNLKATVAAHPSWTVATEWFAGMLQRQNQCEFAAAASCNAVRFIKGKAILSYPTKGCEVRSVTESDLENDLQKWERLGIEEAARLEHSVMLEQLRACASARAAGINWVYAAPESDPSCTRKADEVLEVHQR